jgi:hypothetical protein
MRILEWSNERGTGPPVKTVKDAALGMLLAIFLSERPLRRNEYRLHEPFTYTP